MQAQKGCRKMKMFYISAQSAHRRTNGVRLRLFGTAQAFPVLEPDKNKAQLLTDLGLGLQVIGQ